MSDAAWKGGDYTSNPSRLFDWGFGKLVLTSPEEVNSKSTREQILEEMSKARSDTGGFDVNDKIRQVQAMLKLDVTDKFGGSWERAADAVRAKSLVIVSRSDAVVTPGPALKFAGMIKAKTLILEGNCGHLATVCESSKMESAIRDFLRQQ